VCGPEGQQEVGRTFALQPPEGYDGLAQVPRAQPAVTLLRAVEWKVPQRRTGRAEDTCGRPRSLPRARTVRYRTCARAAIVHRSRATCSSAPRTAPSVGPAQRRRRGRSPRTSPAAAPPGGCLCKRRGRGISHGPRTDRPRAHVPWVRNRSTSPTSRICMACASRRRPCTARLRTQGPTTSRCTRPSTSGVAAAGQSLRVVRGASCEPCLSRRCDPQVRPGRTEAARTRSPPEWSSAARMSVRAARAAHARAGGRGSRTHQLAQISIERLAALGEEDGIEYGH
jgi:hypothetical protein